ncbi:MAG: hydantoinase B/oxoprolinase family protein [Alphaproteobacteria bacterium]|nr:hydantoinase B/oxoprolinase family protein [Alphaproteobacteria bacterium]
MADGIGTLAVGLLWQRMTGLMDEVAHTFVRTSFSSVVRENWDLAVGLMDARGRQFAQSTRSVPSFNATMPKTLGHMLARLPAASLKPGDVLITNDSWFGTGHLNDITMMAPLFRDGRLFAFVGSVAHTVDVGGAPRPEAADSYEEGLTIPPMHIRRAGADNQELFDLLYANLREPDETIGDLRAQFAAYRIAEERLNRILAEEGITDLAPLVDEICDRSERAMRAALSAVPDGTYRDTLDIDGFDAPLKLCCAVTIKDGTITVDYAGTSAQIDRPVNSPMSFTAAYTAYAVKCLFDPNGPNNDGVFRPFRVTAPDGTLVNPRRPAPVWGRHLTGHYLPPAVLGALAPVLPDRVIADCGSPLWNVYFRGLDRRGKRFVKMYFMNGGHGARADGDGPGCLSFPSNVAAQSVEQFEHQVPMLVEEKSFIADSGGNGRYRGGHGQRMSFRSLSATPLTATYRHERVLFPPRGLLGGAPGAPGREYLNGERLPSKTRVTLKAEDLIVFETPGGGGFGNPAERSAEALAGDRASGLVGTTKAAE